MKYNLPIFDIERRNREAELEQLKGEHVDVDFASQIRSCVLHPY